MKPLNVIYLGRSEYWSTYLFQKQMVKKRQTGEIPDTLIIVEHPPVITIGRGGSWKNILVASEVLAKEGIQVYEVDRGGDVTYHGPGQLVCYPIIDLRIHGRDIVRTIRLYEEALINLLKGYGITGERQEGYPGVWIRGAKVAAIGVSVRRWITSHGFALNLQPDLRHFQMIIPCGLNGIPVTSLSHQLKRSVDLEIVALDMVGHFARVWGFDPSWEL